MICTLYVVIHIMVNKKLNVFGDFDLTSLNVHYPRSLVLAHEALRLFQMSRSANNTSRFISLVDSFH